MSPRRVAISVLLAFTAVAAGSCASSSSRPQPAPAALARPADPVEATESWTFGERPGRVLRTANYRIYTTELDPVILSRLPVFLEYAMDHYRSALATLPPPVDRLDTFVLSSRHQWESLTRHFMGEHAHIYLRIPRGGYAWGGRSILYDIGSQGTMAIAAHEGWHQYTQRTFKDGLPIWLEEGIAVYMEGHRWGAGGVSGAIPVFLGWANVERYDQLRIAAASNALIPLEKLLDATPQGLLETAPDSALTYYAQVWALIHFLREGENGRYREGLTRLLTDAAEGRLNRRVASAAGANASRAGLASRRGPVVFATYFTDDLAAVDREFAAFIAQIVRPGTRTPVVEGRSPIQR